MTQFIKLSFLYRSFFNGPLWHAQSELSEYCEKVFCPMWLFGVLQQAFITVTLEPVKSKVPELCLLNFLF